MPKKKLKKNEGIIREPQRRCRNFAASLKTKPSARPQKNIARLQREHHSIKTKSPSIHNEIIIQTQRNHHSNATNSSFKDNEIIIHSQRKRHYFKSLCIVRPGNYRECPTPDDAGNG